MLSLDVLYPVLQDAAPKKRSTFRKYTYRGVDLEKLVVMPMPELIELVHARARRRCALIPNQDLPTFSRNDRVQPSHRFSLPLIALIDRSSHTGSSTVSLASTGVSSSVSATPRRHATPVTARSQSASRPTFVT